MSPAGSRGSDPEVHPAKVCGILSDSQRCIPPSAILSKFVPQGENTGPSLRFALLFIMWWALSDFPGRSVVEFAWHPRKNNFHI